MRVASLLRSILLVGVVGALMAPPAVSVATEPSPGRDGAWPLQPRPALDRGFDPPTRRFGAGHRGVDLVGHAGQPVHTSLPGVVTFASTLAGRGVVVVDHGEIRTTYEPVSASVGAGDTVTRGAVVGRLQRASSHCFPRACLHWGLRRGDIYLDPLTLVGGGPVRLLPIEWTAPAVTGGGPTGPSGANARAPSTSSRVPARPSWQSVVGEPVSPAPAPRSRLLRRAV